MLTASQGKIDDKINEVVRTGGLHGLLLYTFNYTEAYYSHCLILLMSLQFSLDLKMGTL